MLNYHRKTVDTSVGKVDLITLKSSEMEVVLTSFGAAIFQIYVLGKLVTVQPKHLEDFLRSPFFYGKTIGRTSGRLVLPSFQLNNKVYPISSFGGKNVKLHGGAKGFAFKPFRLKDYTINEQKVSVTFSYTSNHMEEEFPGKLELDVMYTLDLELGLLIEYRAYSDQDTLCNITNHTYFNLSIEKQTILEHELLIQSDNYLDINDEMIVKTKESVNNSPFDFRNKSHLGNKIKLMLDTPFKGFDHTWLFNTNKNQVEVDEPSSHVKMIVDTSYPSVVIYTHNFPIKEELEDIQPGGIHSSFTLECQFEPGGIHHEFLNSGILHKNQMYKHHILYRFIKK